MKQIMWRNSSIFPKLFLLDARAIFPIFLFILHWAYWTLTLSIICIAILIFLQKRGLTIIVGLRYLKLYVLNGSRRRVRLTEAIIRKRCRW